MKPIISIITPVYKAESFIGRCIKSVLGQTYKDWELILIDDGSPDDSGVICDKYSKNDSRIKCIHKENGGVSSARNLGLDKATGDFVTFVDSDDFIGATYLEAFAAHTEYDLMFTGIHRVGSVDYTLFGEKDIPFPTSQSLVLEIKNCSDEKGLSLGGLSFVACKALRRSIIEHNHIRFHENMIYGEDTIFVYEFIQYINNAIQIKGNEYYYDTPSKPHVFKLTPDSFWQHCTSYKNTVRNLEDRFELDLSNDSISYCVSAFIQFFKYYLSSNLNTKRQYSKDFFKLPNKIIFNHLIKEKGSFKALVSMLSLRFPILGHYIICKFIN